MGDWSVSQIQSAAPLIYTLGNHYDITGLQINQRKKIWGMLNLLCLNGLLGQECKHDLQKTPYWHQIISLYF